MPATRLFAYVAGGDAPTGVPPSLFSGSGVTGVERNATQVGRYLVAFDRDLIGCVAVVSRSGTGALFDGFVTYVSARIADDLVLLSVFDSDQSFVESGCRRRLLLS